MQISNNGDNLTQSLSVQKIEGDNRDSIVRQVEQILTSIVDLYNSKYEQDPASDDNAAGLIYGRIQSGKTRAMIVSAAMAIDSGFRVVVVITSDIDKLVDQTRNRFRQGLPTVRVVSKTEFGREQEAESVKKFLQQSQDGLLIVCSKGSVRLKQAIEFLQSIEAKNYPSIIFDDEGDQASLDTNTYNRIVKNSELQASTINRLLHSEELDSIRKELSKSIYVSVTGTPQAIVLQNINDRTRPSFIKMLEPGKGYTGGAHFFSDVQAEYNNARLIKLISENERIELLPKGAEAIEVEIPAGLKQAINYFVVSAVTAGKQIGWPEEGYKFLCHPSVKMSDHAQVEKLMGEYINAVVDSLNDASANAEITQGLESAYNDLLAVSPDLSYATFEKFKQAALRPLNHRKILVINAKSKAGEYGNFLNFLIGGNTLGRGISIENLLVTYYVREPKVSNIDTMYQHARMFGYREPLLPYTKVFLPPQLNNRFKEIFHSDEALREFIQKNVEENNVLHVQLGKGIRATRKGVLDPQKVGYLFPGAQVYPNKPLPPDLNSLEKITKKVESELAKITQADSTEIDLDTAISIIKPIKTSATNSWTTKDVNAILQELAVQYGGKFLLKQRTAKRTFGEGQTFVQGVLSGDEVKEGRDSASPVLWVVKTEGTDKNNSQKYEFYFPTLIVPGAAKLTVYNKSASRVG